jgi:SAM-dependent methyltransferase
MAAGHLALLEPVLETGGGLLDIGAGTGRIAIPVARAGHRVTAVEPSVGMLARLRLKAESEGVQRLISPVGKPIQSIVADDRIRGDHDAAICVFTTLHHILDAESLGRSLRAIAAGLRAGGTALLGVQRSETFGAFASGRVQDVHVAELGGQVMWRQTVRPRGSDDALLDAVSRIELPDGRRIEDRFGLRPRSRTEVISTAQDAGLRHHGSGGIIGLEEVLVFRRDR